MIMTAHLIYYLLYNENLKYENNWKMNVLRKKHLIERNFHCICSGRCFTGMFYRGE